MWEAHFNLEEFHVSIEALSFSFDFNLVSLVPIALALALGKWPILL